jgi:hypothetical protein
MEWCLKTGSEGSLASARRQGGHPYRRKGTYFLLYLALSETSNEDDIFFAFLSKIILIFVEPSLLDVRKFSLSHPYWDVRVKSHSRNKVLSESLKITSNVGPWGWAVNKMNE